MKSASVLVLFTIQGDEDDPETGVESSFRVERPNPPRALTLFQLREAFPFIGTFHFRLKVPDDSGASDYMWMDLTTDGDDIVELARDLGGLEGTNGSEPRIYLKVLPLDFGNPDDGGFQVEEGVFAEDEGGGIGIDGTEDDLVAEMSGVDIASDDVTSRRRYSEGYHEETGEDNRHEGSRGTRGEGRGDVGFNRGYSGEDDDGDWRASVVTSASQGVKDLQKKSAQVAKTMGFGAKKLWQTVNKVVGGPQPASPEALENLKELSAMLGSPFVATNREHLADLGAIWACFFPGEEFEGAESARWKEVGFQEAKVSTDFRGTGVLALKSMVHFCKNYERKAQAMCRAQARKSASTSYPWAVVANNLTLMLADVLELRASRFTSSRRGYWGVFDRRAAYFEIFCTAFGVLDTAWTNRQATRQQFGQIIGYTKSCIQGILETDPPNLQEFMAQAEEMGMLR